MERPADQPVALPAFVAVARDGGDPGKIRTGRDGSDEEDVDPIVVDAPLVGQGVGFGVTAEVIATPALIGGDLVVVHPAQAEAGGSKDRA